MKTLVAKEMRLLLPSFAMSLLLALMPLWLNLTLAEIGGNASDYVVTWMIYPLCFGILIMALSSFGREYGMATYPLLLALPVERASIWRAKIIVLAGAMATVFGAWYFACHAWHSVWTQSGDEVQPARIALVFVVIFASGLWTTVLLRQIVSAFWFAVLIPTAIFVFITWNGGKVLTAEIVLLVYSAAGCWWARRLFYRAEEVAWTGGEVTLPEWRSAKATSCFAGRTYQPLAALVWKELRLYQIALAGMAVLFVLHLAAVALRKLTHNEAADYSAFTTAVEEFGVLWLLVPVVTGGLNVADERRMGTLEAHLCLPFSRLIQFLIKLFTVLFISGFLCAFLFWIAEHTDSHSRAGDGIFGTHYLARLGLFRLSLVFMGLSLLMFYASSMARGILQTVFTAGVTVIGAISFWTALSLFVMLTNLFARLWWFEFNGLLYELIAWPAMIIAVIWLAYSNFQRLSETRRLFWRNVRGLVGAMLIALVITVLIFYRTWEYLTPLEPAHGPAKLSLSSRPQFHNNDSISSVLLPDGRLWWDRIAYDPPKTLFTIADNPDALGSARLRVIGQHYAGGSNWVQAIDCNGQLVGIQSDGTLWSEEPVSWTQSPDGRSMRPRPGVGRMERFGDAADWKSLAREGNSSAVLLKTDGTLWHWGTNNVSTWTDLNRYLPHRLGSAADWSEILSLPYITFIWKRDGTAWRLGNPIKGRENFEIVFEPNLAAERWKSFDDIKWRSLAGGYEDWIGVREDGTLWTISKSGSDVGNQYYRVIDKGYGQPVQVGADHDWVSVANGLTRILALKADGTLWEWGGSTWAYYSFDPKTEFAKPPTRLGTHNDWVAIDGPCSMAADGSLWCWYAYDNPSLLAPSRKPAKFDNIFSQ